ncbi:MAG: hypothetical protein NZM07_03650 [Elioraea sp.]|nr:hypothetical protein [Elioraea sp.]
MTAEKVESLLGHCLMRAALRRVKGDGRLAAGYAAVRAVPYASRVAAFIALWAIALDELGVEELGVERYGDWAAESKATVYRRLAEFRELFPEYRTPNEVARVVLETARTRGVVPGPEVQVALP